MRWDPPVWSHLLPAGHQSDAPRSAAAHGSGPATEVKSNLFNFPAKEPTEPSPAAPAAVDALADLGAAMPAFTATQLS